MQILAPAQSWYRRSEYHDELQQARMETLASFIIKKKAIEAGFNLVGIAPVQNLPDLEFARMWTEKGYAGEMHYLKNPKRTDPHKLFPTLRSAIWCRTGLQHTPALLHRVVS